MNLNRLLVVSIIVPSVFVVAVTLASFLPHQAEVLSHSREHIVLAAVMVAGIVPFSIFIVRVFRRIERHILMQNEELARHNREVEALLQVSHAVEESLELDKFLPPALEAVVNATTVDSAEVWLPNAGGESVSLRYSHGSDEDAFLEITELPRGEGYPGIVMETGEPILVHDLPNDSRFLRERVKTAGFHTIYALPLRRTGDTIGVLIVASREPSALSSQDELNLLQVMADQIATAIENAHLHQEVQTFAILQERDRLAREMHDGLGQVLGYVNTKTQAVKELLKRDHVDAAVVQMEQLETAAQDTYDDVREAILALRRNGVTRPLLESLDEYIQRFSEFAELPTELVVEGAPHPFNPAIEVQLLRIVQEALANIRKHAGATGARVVLTFQDVTCRLLIEDNGKGFDPNQSMRGPWPHFGLQSMRERAAAIGAEFTLDTAPGAGTRVIVNLPQILV